MSNPFNKNSLSRDRILTRHSKILMFSFSLLLIYEREKLVDDSNPPEKFNLDFCLIESLLKGGRL